MNDRRFDIYAINCNRSEEWGKCFQWPTGHLLNILNMTTEYRRLKCPVY